MATPPEKPKRIVAPPRKVIVCEIPDCEMPAEGVFAFYPPDPILEEDGSLWIKPTPIAIPYEVRYARVKKNEKEKEHDRRLYSREYMKRPDVREKIQKRLKSPKVIAAKAVYAARTDVQERKKEIAKQKRRHFRLVKEEYPETHVEVMNKIVT